MTFKIKVFILCLILIFVGIQFYRPNKNQQLVRTLDDFLLYEKAPKNVADLLKNSCYDCHSEFTNYKWYHNVSPLSWWIDSHTEKGKKSLNLSNWAVKDVRDKRSMLSAIAYDVNEEIMPINSYVLLHPETKLSEKDKKEIMTWLYTIEVN